MVRDSGMGGLFILARGTLLFFFVFFRIFPWEFFPKFILFVVTFPFPYIHRFRIFRVRIRITLNTIPRIFLLFISGSFWRGLSTPRLVLFWRSLRKKDCLCLDSDSSTGAHAVHDGRVFMDRCDFPLAIFTCYRIARRYPFGIYFVVRETPRTTIMQPSIRHAHFIQRFAAKLFPAITTLLSGGFELFITDRLTAFRTNIISHFSDPPRSFSIALVAPVRSDVS